MARAFSRTTELSVHVHFGVTTLSPRGQSWLANPTINESRPEWLKNQLPSPLLQFLEGRGGKCGREA